MARVVSLEQRMAWPSHDPGHRQAVYKANRERLLEDLYERTYGITYAQRERLLADQDGRCAICKTTDPGKSRQNKFGVTAWAWHTDHNPAKPKGAPGFIRGILCLKCNTGQGKFRHSPELLMAAAIYLERGNDSD